MLVIAHKFSRFTELGLRSRWPWRFANLMRELIRPPGTEAYSIIQRRHSQASHK